MDEVKPQKKNRFEKGSQEAKEFMAGLRAKKGTKKPPHHHPRHLLHHHRLHLLVLFLLH